MNDRKPKPPSKYQRLRQQIDERDRRHSWEIRCLQYEMRERFEAETRYLRQQNETLMQQIATIVDLSPPPPFVIRPSPRGRTAEEGDR